MSNLEENDGDLKAILASDLSDGEKLVAIAKLLGAASAGDVAAMLSKPVRTVERHYANLRKVRKIAGTQNCGITQICVEKPANLRSETTQNCVDASRARPEYSTRATKELPSEVHCSKIITPPYGPPSPKTEPPKAKRGTRLPNDFEMPDDWLDWVATNCPASNPQSIAVQAMMFTNYWQSKAGANATKVDWLKTWKNWALKAFASAPVRPHGMAPMSASERKMERGRALLAELDAQMGVAQ